MMRNLILLLLISFNLVAQTNKQPKVGLVLSGGGAKGFAHIGALKVIEKSGVKIDYIAGTSMGAIIGALYASGYSADQLERIINNTDFNTILQDKIERRNYPLFTKTYQDKFAISLPITSKGIGIPRGVSKGQNIRNFFTQLFSPIGNINDFSKLPIPFLCLATDIETGEKVVFEKGSLNLAVQASGAFPTLLHPVEVDGKLLIDGGVVNNFPVEELKKKGIDIIIGLDVQDELADRKELNSAVDLLNQIIAFNIHKKSNLQKKDVDVHIHPELDGYSVISFDESKDIIKKGEIKAKLFVKTLDSIARLQSKEIKVKPFQKTDYKFTLSKIAIEGNKNFTDHYILGSMDIQLEDTLTYSSVSKNISKLQATGNFKTIDYSFKELTSKKKSLHIKVDEVKDRSFLKLGIHYDELFGSGLLVNYTHKSLLINNDILSFGVVLGDKFRYDLNYFVDNGFHLGFGFKSSYKTFNANVSFSNFNEGLNLDVDFSEVLNRIYLQTKFKKKYALSVGADYRIYKGNSKTLLVNNKPISYEDTDYALFFANLMIDNFDKSIYPTRGFYLSSTFDWITYSDRNNKDNQFINTTTFNPFTQLKFVFSASNTFFDTLTLQHTFEGGFSLGNIPTDAFAFKIGSYNKNLFGNFINFYGFDIAEYKRNNFLKGEALIRYNFYRKHNLLFHMNLIKMDKEQFLEEQILDNILPGFAAGYGLETFLGPIELKYSWSPQSISNGKVLFNLGFWF